MSKLSTMSYQELMKFLITENLNEQDVQSLIKDSFWLDSIEKIKAEKEKWSDFWDDKAYGSDDYRNLLLQRAQIRAQLASTKIAKGLITFTDYINQVIEEHWGRADIRTIIAVWQCNAYEEQGNELLKKLRELEF